MTRKSRRGGNSRFLDNIQKWEKKENDAKVEKILLKDENCWKGEFLAEIHGNRKRRKSLLKTGNIGKTEVGIDRNDRKAEEILLKKGKCWKGGNGKNLDKIRKKEKTYNGTKRRKSCSKRKMLEKRKSC